MRNWPPTKRNCRTGERRYSDRWRVSEISESSLTGASIGGEWFLEPIKSCLMSQVCQSINMSLKAWLIGSSKRKHDEDTPNCETISISVKSCVCQMLCDMFSYNLNHNSSHTVYLFWFYFVQSLLVYTTFFPKHLTISQSEGVYIFCFEIHSKPKKLLIWCFKSVCVCMCVCAIKFFDWGWKYAIKVLGWSGAVP